MARGIINMFTKYRLVFLFVLFMMASLLVFGNGCSPTGGDQRPFGKSNVNDGQAPKSEASYAIESALDGSGKRLTAFSIKLNEPVELFAILRKNDEYLSPTTVAWELEDYSLSPGVKTPLTQGSSYSFSSNKTGLYIIYATAGEQLERARIFVTDPNNPIFNYDLALHIEDRGDGSGSPIGTLNAEEEIWTDNFYLVLRKKTGEFLDSIQPSWDLTNIIGELKFDSVDKGFSFWGAAGGVGMITFEFGTLRVNVPTLITKPVLEQKGFWLNLYAVGPKTNANGDYIRSDGSTSSQISDSDMMVKLAWNSLPDLNVGSWEVFRSLNSQNYDFNNPLSVIADPSQKSFSDSSVNPQTTYFYLVLPRVNGSLVTNHEKISELEVIVPGANMAFIHRSMANKVVCEGLHISNAKTIDFKNNYRCAYMGPANNNGFFDIGGHLIVDRFEAGCNTSLTDVAYNSSGLCTLKGLREMYLTPSQIAGIMSPSAHLPPLANVNQEKAFAACELRSVSFSKEGNNESISMGLANIVEFRAASAWSESLTYSEISQIEYRQNIYGCNTNYARNGLPEDVLFSNFSKFRTGSRSTKACTSRFGLQDHIGNLNEWSSDQCDWAIDPTDGSIALCQEPSNPLATSNIWGSSVWRGFRIRNSTFFEPALGLPLNTKPNGSLNTIQAIDFLNDDAAYGISSGKRSIAVGGGFADANKAGRWSMRSDLFPHSNSSGIGFRCSAKVP